MEYWAELYQEVILDHNKKPRNKGKISPCSHEAEGYNPLCGDQINLTINVEENKIKDIAFEGHGCAISVASASMMTEATLGKNIEDALGLSKAFRECVTEDVSECKNLQDLEILKGVKEFPMRVKCATLAWHTLDSALMKKNQKVSTE